MAITRWNIYCIEGTDAGKGMGQVDAHSAVHALRCWNRASGNFYRIDKYTGTMTYIPSEEQPTAYAMKLKAERAK